MSVLNSAEGCGGLSSKSRKAWCASGSRLNRRWSSA